MEVLCWRGRCGIWGFDKFFFLCFGIFIFSFCFFGKSPENEFPISRFPFLILRFDLMLIFATHALIYIPILSSDPRAKKKGLLHPL